MNLTLNSKVALITGGARGIRAAAVRIVLAAGPTVSLNSPAPNGQAGQRRGRLHGHDASASGGLINMSKGRSTATGGERMYSNAWTQGWVDTDMSTPVINDPPMRADIFRDIPLGRVGTPE